MKNTIKIIISLCLILSLFSTCVFAKDTAFSVEDITAGKESTVNIPISITNAKNIGSFDIIFSYDPEVISFKDSDKGDLTKGLLQSNLKNPGELSIAVADTSGIDGNGEVVMLSFDVIGNVGSSSRLEIEEVKAYDVESHTDILTEKNNGVFTVTQKNKTSYALIGLLILVLIGIVVFLVSKKKPVKKKSKRKRK